MAVRRGAASGSGAAPDEPVIGAADGAAFGESSRAASGPAAATDEPGAATAFCRADGATFGEISRAASRSAAGLPKDRSFASLADTSPRGDGRAAGGAAETTGKTAVAAEREVCGLIGTDALAR